MAIVLEVIMQSARECKFGTSFYVHTAFAVTIHREKFPSRLKMKFHPGTNVFRQQPPGRFLNRRAHFFRTQ